MADYNKLLQIPRGTKARLETIKLDLLVNTIVYATDTKELGIKLSDGNIEYFKNATDIDARIDTIETSKQDKLVAGDNITIDENTNTISASDVVLTKADVGLDKVMNYGIASKSQSEIGMSDSVYMTPLRTTQLIAVVIGDIESALDAILGV